jgi:hypothetical protein
MLDPKDGDSRGMGVDLVDDAIRASSGGPQSCKFSLQRVADPARLLAQRPDHELDNGGSDACGKPGKLSLG